MKTFSLNGPDNSILISDGEYTLKMCREDLERLQRFQESSKVKAVSKFIPRDPIKHWRDLLSYKEIAELNGKFCCFNAELLTVVDSDTDIMELKKRQKDPRCVFFPFKA